MEPTQPKTKEARAGETLACLECGRTLQIRAAGRLPKFCCDAHKSRYNARKRRRRDGGRAGAIAKHVAKQEQQRADDQEQANTRPAVAVGNQLASMEKGLAVNSLSGPGIAEVVVLTKAKLVIEETAVRYPNTQKEGGK